jgi:Chromosome segregation ATPases
MSDNTETEETISIVEDGLTVKKSFTSSEFPVPVVSFRIESDGDEPVRVRVIDEIPESFPMERIGFHPEFEGDNWTAYENHTVEYERILEPDTGEVHTIYGIRAEDPDIDAFLTSPSITKALLDEEIESVIGSDDSDAVREVIAGDRDTLLGIDEAEDEDSGSVGVDSPSQGTATESHNQENRSSITPDTEQSSADPAPDSAVAESTDDTASVESTGEDAEAELNTADSVAVPSAENPSSRASVSDDDGVAAALADEIRSGTVDDEDLSLLAENLELVDHGSVSVQIEHIQSQLADLEAYTSALEEFLNEEGTAQQVFADLRNDMNKISNNIADLSSRIDHANSNRQEVKEVAEEARSTANSIDSRVTDISASVEDNSESVTDLTSQLQAATGDMDSLDSALGEIRDELADIDTQVESMEEQFEDRLETETEELEDQIETEIGELDDRIETGIEESDDELAEMSEELSEVRERLDEFEAFRESLSDAFGN